MCNKWKILSETSFTKTLMHYLTSILLKFVSSENRNREPVGFEVSILTGHKLQQNTREIMLLLSILGHIIWFRKKIEK